MNKDPNEMKTIRIGKLIWSNCGMRQDISFGFTPAKHLFWCFWWSEDYN